MLSIASRVRNMLRSFGDFAFTRAQLLACGNSNAVDIELCRLVKKGVITRLASGVYISSTAKKNTPSLRDLARIKAERFGKKLLECLNKSQGQEANVFFTNGSSGSFESIHGRAGWKHLAPRKRKETPGLNRTESKSSIESGVCLCQRLAAAETSLSLQKADPESATMILKMLQTLATIVANWDRCKLATALQS